MKWMGGSKDAADLPSHALVAPQQRRHDPDGSYARVSPLSEASL